MGLFDTIHLEPPLSCPGCGTALAELQTKHFGNIMTHYRIGSVVSGSPVLTGILKDRLWCSDCHKAGQTTETDIYLVVWHSILAAVETDPDRAEHRMASIDRLDLVGWLDQAQHGERAWQSRFFRLRGDIERWREHLHEKDQPAETDERLRSFRRIFALPDEVLEAEDPLAEILKRNEADAEDDGVF